MKPSKNNKTKTKNSPQAPRPLTEKQVMTRLARENKLRTKLIIKSDRLALQIEVLREELAATTKAIDLATQRVDALTLQLPPSKQLELSLAALSPASSDDDVKGPYVK